MRNDTIARNEIEDTCRTNPAGKENRLLEKPDFHPCQDEGHDQDTVVSKTFIWFGDLIRRHQWETTPKAVSITHSENTSFGNDETSRTERSELNQKQAFSRIQRRHADISRFDYDNE